MVRFRCKRSGNYITLKNQADIDGLRKHEGYEEVVEIEDKSIQQDKSDDNPPEIKRRRRKV